MRARSSAIIEYSLEQSPPYRTIISGEAKNCFVHHPDIGITRAETSAMSYTAKCKGLAETGQGLILLSRTSHSAPFKP